jgi:dipeptidyl-peptidase-4
MSFLFLVCASALLAASGSQEPGPSPDSRHLAFVKANNLWISSADGSHARALTQGGNENLLVGLPDVVFGREFDVRRHYWWSPDSARIAYIETEFQDSNHYVVPGGQLPQFRLKVVNVVTGKIDPVAESSNEWPYLLRVAWHPDSKSLILYRMNRLQTAAELDAYQDGELQTLLTEKDAYWVNAPETPVFVDAGRKMVVSSERSGNKHVYLYESDGTFIRDLTPPDLEVSQLHIAPDANHVYVTGSTGNRQDQQLFRLPLDGINAEQVTSGAGWHEVKLNATGSSFADCFSSAMQAPEVDLKDRPVANEFFYVKTHDNVALPARLFKPDNFDDKKKYPVILYTFSGPRGRVVKDEWGGWQMAWNRSMVRQGFLVLAVDVRGSGGYGHLFEEYIHYRFGAQEVADLREVVSYLRRLSYVDGERLGIWGCGYGAHTVVHAMWQFPGGFKAGFADSPISDWTKYDAYYTERYLGLPAHRFNEYNDSSPLHDARKMTGSLMVTSRPDDPLIRAEQLEALQKAMAGVKSEEVRKRFEVLSWPSDPEKLAAAMTEFFKRTL